ncbi:NlpC/P60 family protein [Streptomyces sp. NPDC058252]|uniref:NlpC/P60 family protein n=1 Tax=Streptomyces sp. NPDC058252 TaxID=3346405 RepID=UPI0036F13106
MAESTVAGQGPLLGWNKAQDAISALTRTINDLNKGLQGVNSGVGQMGRARGLGLAVGDVWNGTSNFNQSRPNGGQVGSSFGGGGNGGGIRFSNNGGQGGGPANNGGQGGPGGPGGPGNGGGTNTPRLGGGAANNGGRPSLKSGIQGFVNWSQGKLSDQVAMQTVAYQAAQYSTSSWSNLRDQAVKNNFGAQSTADGLQAYARMSQVGLSPGSSAFNTQWNYVRGTSGLLSPGMSETARAQGTTAAWSAQTYNTLRQFGIQTIKGGQKQSPRQIAQQIYQQFPELKKVTTQAQLSATLNDPASGLNQSLNSWGLDSNTLQLVKGELRGMMISQIKGGSANSYVSLANRADKNSAEGSQARQQLKSMGIGWSNAQRLQDRAGTLRNQDANINDAFTSGLDTATKYLDKFSSALQGVLQATGANSLIGGAAGAGSMIGGAIGGGLSALGMARGLGAVGRIAGMGAGGGGGGLLGGVLGGGGGAAARGLGSRLGVAGLGVAGAYAVNQVGHAGASHIGNAKLRSMANIATSTGSYALAGAAIGSFGGPVGTVIGGTVGGAIGLGKGLWDAYHDRPEQHWTSVSGNGIHGGAGESNSSSAAGSGNSKSAATGTQGAGKTAAAVIRVAMKYLGVKYVWGGNTPKGFDCSGLIQFSFKQIGVSLPRVASQQQKAGKPVKLGQERAGDLLFNGNPAHHVVMCIGNGKIIEAPHTNAVVRVRSYRSGEFTNAVRILGSVGNMGDLTNDDSDTAGSGSNRLSTMGFGGDVGSYGSVEEVDAIAAGLSGIGAANVGSGVGAGQNSTKATDNGSTSAGPLPTGNLKTWIKSALGILHKDTAANERIVNSMAMHESGGNPRAQNNWDSNAKAGHPSKGLLQTIDSTFNRWSLSGHKDIWNPVDNTIAGVRYAESRYGSLANVPGIKSMANGGSYKGYAVGSANIDVDQTARVHKGEMIIPAFQAEAVRNALAGNTPLTSGVGGLHTKASAPTLNFNSGSVVVQVQGVMDQQTARDAAQQFMNALAEDNRINLIAAGN